MEMKDVGRMMKPLEAQPAMAQHADKKSYPMLFLDNGPEELMGKEIGHTCRLTILVKVKGKNMRDGDEGPIKTVDLEVQKVGYAGSGKKTKDEYLKLPEKERSEYDKDSVLNDDEEETDDEHTTE